VTGGFEPHISWKTGPVHNLKNARLMGPANHKRIPIRTDAYAHIKLLYIATTPRRSGNDAVVETIPRFCITYLPGSKEGRIR